MKRLVLLLIISLSFIIFAFRAYALGGEGDGGGNDENSDGGHISSDFGVQNGSGTFGNGSGGSFTNTVNPDGSVTQTCGNGLGGMTYAAPPGNGGEGGGGGEGETPPPTGSNYCIPEGQSCPQFAQAVTCHQVHHQYCSIATQQHGACTINNYGGHMGVPTTAGGLFGTQTTTSTVCSPLEDGTQGAEIPCCSGVCNNGVCGDIPPPPTSTPVPPDLTPTPTVQPPACGVTCSNDFGCQAAKDGCTACIANKCIVPPSLTPLPTSTPVPSPTPTTPPAACGLACSNDFGCQSAKDGCTACIANKCAVPPTPTPTLTPTPVFQPQCTCDGIQNTDIFSGQQITITANAKVPANIASKQQVLDQSFALYKGADTLVTRLAHAEAVPAIQISQAADFVRYQSKWTFTMPALEAGQTYRIGAQLNCQPKITGFNFTPSTNRAVLGAQDDNPSFVQKLLNIIAALLGRSPSQNVAVNIPPTPTPITVSQTTNSISVTPARTSLQLGYIQPGEVYEKTCDYIKFRYNGF